MGLLVIRLLEILAVISVILKLGEAVSCYVCDNCPDSSYSFPDSDLESGCASCRVYANPSNKKVYRTCESFDRAEECQETMLSTYGLTTECFCSTDKCNDAGVLPSVECYECSITSDCNDEYNGKESHIRRHCKYCKKTKSEIIGIKTSTRECKVDEMPEDLKCTDTEILTIKSTTCFCNGNLCNEATDLKASLAVIFISMLTRLFGLW